METASPARITDPIERLDDAEARDAAASANRLEAIWEADERELWRRDGATSMSAWLAARYALAGATARERLRVARAVKDLPRIFEAHRAGRLSWDQLRPLARFATPDSDKSWAHRGPRLRPATLWREAERHRRVGATDEAQARRRRYLSLWWDTDLRMLCLSGMLPPEEGAAVEAALARRAEDIVLTDTPDTPGEARLADALAELVTETGTGNGPVPTVVLHADAPVLTGEERAERPWLAETESGHRLPGEAIRRLACDGRIEWLLESGGRPVGIGRRGRAVPGALMRALRHRDEGTCRFPGCERRRWLRAHHLVHWAHGGATTLDNLVLLCHAHHRLVHEEGWRTSGHPGRELRFHDPGGRALRGYVSASRTAVALRL